MRSRPGPFLGGIVEIHRIIALTTRLPPPWIAIDCCNARWPREFFISSGLEKYPLPRSRIWLCVSVLYKICNAPFMIMSFLASVRYLPGAQHGWPPKRLTQPRTLTVVSSSSPLWWLQKASSCRSCGASICSLSSVMLSCLTERSGTSQWINQHPAVHILTPAWTAVRRRKILASIVTIFITLGHLKYALFQQIPQGVSDIARITWVEIRRQSDDLSRLIRWSTASNYHGTKIRRKLLSGKASANCETRNGIKAELFGEGIGSRTSNCRYFLRIRFLITLIISNTWIAISPIYVLSRPGSIQDVLFNLALCVLSHIPKRIPTVVWPM